MTDWSGRFKSVFWEVFCPKLEKEVAYEFCVRILSFPSFIKEI